MNDSRSFLKAFTWVSGVLIGLIASFNWFLNPFGLFDSPEFQGINEVKPRIQGHIRMLKAHQLIDVRPHGLILGSSRAETGLDPEHPGWLSDSRPVYNSALPSGRIYELYHYLRHAHTHGKIRQVVLGLDEFMFDDNFQSEPGFDLARLDMQPRMLPNSIQLKDFLTALLSYDALSASIDTWSGHNRSSPGYLPNGSQDPERRRDLVRIKGGHYSAFEAAITSSMKSNDGLAAVSYRGAASESSALEWFKTLVHFCVRERIDLYLYISPVHAQWLEALWRLDKWDDYERWKRDIVKVVDTASLQAGGTSKIELWDFSGFNAVTQEAVPPPGDSKSEMHWYWEASHFKMATGNLILDRILGSKISDVDPNFGVRLSLASIEDHLSAMRADLARYEKEKPDDVEFIAESIARFVPRLAQSGSQ